MARDQLLQNPLTARLILAIGATIYFFACSPLYGRRGFPEVDPFWLAMIWLWVPPVFLSAIYHKWCRRRAYDLIIYGLVAGFIVSWGTVTLVPNRKGPFEALFELILYGPVLIVLVMLVESLSRGVLTLVRRFPPQKQCENCDDSLHGLTEPRCPECGTPFPKDLLDPHYCPAITPFFKRWSMLLIAITLLATVGWPLVYRAYAFHSEAVTGARLAESAWENGYAKWYVTNDEMQAMTPDQREHFYMKVLRQKDPSTGLEIDLMWTDWEHQTWQSSYQRVIERKLRESGLTPPNFGPASFASQPTATSATKPSIAVE